MSRVSLRLASIGCALALCSGAIHAQHVPANTPALRAAFSGNWFSSDQAGHGVQIEILDGARAVVAWYTYSSDGTPLWLFGTGRINGAGIEAELSSFSGGRPPAQWAQGDLQAEVWGTVNLEFSGCSQGTLSWDSSDPAFGTGELELTRLTSIQGQSCPGEEQFGLQLSYSFEHGTQGFEAVFADLPVDFDPAIYEMDFRREQLPQPLTGWEGLRLTGHNRSDDLAMLVKRAIHGLEANTHYRVEIDADLASNVPQNCVGVGGSPGEGLYVKLGAATQEPQAVADPADNWLRLNVGYGVQSSGGEDARVVGNLSNSQDCETAVEADWELKTVTTQGQTLFANTDENGVLWVFAGTDSAFEGFTQYYLTGLRVRLEPVEASAP